MLSKLAIARLIVASVGIGAAGLIGAPCAAQDATAWDGDQRAAARLLAGGRNGTPNDAALSAGLEIKLAPGWKTYWRYPGDSGVPPRFDFSGSDNLKTVDVAWPAPHRFSDEGGNSIGYKTDVLLPLRIVPQDAQRPVTLRLRLDYAVCEKLCVPAEAKAELQLSGKSSSFAAPLAAARMRVPKSAALGAEGPLAIRAVHRENTASGARVLVDVAAPPGQDVALFAEGPTADWALPVPEPEPGAAPGLQRFAFALDGLPPGADARDVQLRLTAVAGDAAIEVSTHLD
jgi:DsbC/DsbD-like thiol-disulfide interchange protein